MSTGTAIGQYGSNSERWAPGSVHSGTTSYAPRVSGRTSGAIAGNAPSMIRRFWGM